MKLGKVDILLVVNMFLTGFDSKRLNTLYVDKNLRYHGLIQAYSRTNRILNEVKSQGNIVVFRNLKKATDEAVALFSNVLAKEEIFIPPYQKYAAKFNEVVIDLLALALTVRSVKDLPDEEAELQHLRKLILDSVAGDLELRSKRELIEKFIESNLPQAGSAAEIPDCFEGLLGTGASVSLREALQGGATRRGQAQAGHRSFRLHRQSSLARPGHHPTHRPAVEAGRTRFNQNAGAGKSHGLRGNVYPRHCGVRSAWL